MNFVVYKIRFQHKGNIMCIKNIHQEFGARNGSIYLTPFREGDTDLEGIDILIIKNNCAVLRE